MVSTNPQYPGITELSWTTIERWLEIAALYAHNFNEQYLKGYEIQEVQVDEIRTFVDSKKKVHWLFTAIEVSTRLWISKVLGSRTYKNVKKCMFQIIQSSRISGKVLLTTDGFDMYRLVCEKKS